LIGSAERVSVFLVAENRLLRESLARILDKKNDIAVVGAYPFSPGLADKIASAAPRVLLFDSFNADVPHLQFIRQVRRSVPKIKVIMIGMDEEPQNFLQAVREGVAGYVLEDAPSMEIIAAVQAVVKGQAVCPLELCSCLFQQVAGSWNQMPTFKVKCNLGLTNREQQLVFLLGRGMTNKEIASQLQLAEQTVRNHVHHMLRKLGATDRLAVVEMCRTEGLPV
jgi:two-component system, NarL family, response regulator DevR